MSIAIIGGGPVGLTVAIRLINNSHYMEKDVPKDTTIHIYEKREKYTRTQYIVSGGSKGDILQNYPYQLQDELRENFMCYIDNPVTDMNGYCLDDRNYSEDSWKKFSQTIEISKFEKILSNYIKKHFKNIKIIKKEFTKKDQENYKVIIGCDGLHSYVRDKLMNVKWKELKDYNTYILHIKYKDTSNRKYIIDNSVISDQILNAYELIKKKPSQWEIDNGFDKKKFFEQDRFRLIRSNGSMTQFLLQITKSQYDKLKKIKKCKNLPDSIKNSILIDSFIMGSKPKDLDNTPINVYKAVVGHAKQYVTYKDNRLYMLIGDSAMTTHIFSGEGLNINLFPLKRSINNFLESEKNIDDIIKSYNRYMNYQFDHHVKYVAMLRYLPQQLLKKICSKIKLVDISVLLENELRMHKYDYILKKLQKKYKHLSDTDVKNELCLIFRDKILKYFTYKM